MAYENLVIGITAISLLLQGLNLGLGGVAIQLAADNDSYMSSINALSVPTDS